jgi:addiction module HigA family antidote
MTTTNYAVAPGAYLEEWIDENDLSQQQVANMLGCSRKQVNEIINGRAPVTADTAMRLERVVGVPADAWLRYEALYKADQARIAEEQELKQYADEIDADAAKYLRTIGATKATKAKPGQLVSDFLAFHRCGTWSAYELLNESANHGDYALAALKQTAAATIEPTLLSTWLRAGELTENFEDGRRYSYDSGALRRILPDLRERAASSDEDLLNDLAAMLAGVGVVFMLVEPPAKFPLLGMTRWIDKRVPVIQQTGRWGKDGFIIWTLFHEIGHVLNDPRGEVHLDFKSEKQRNSVAERNANGFARDVLFGETGIEPFLGLTSDYAIARTARNIGVSPGVAVHQLHRTRQLDYSFGNRLCVDLGGTFGRARD